MGADSLEPSSRLYWQCRRGMRELDDLLRSFLDQGYASLNEKQRDTFEQLLKCPDALLLEYLMGRTVPRDPQTANVVHLIRTASGAAF